MKHCIILALAPLLFSCVAPGDLDRISDRLDQVYAVADDTTKTGADLGAAVDALEDEIVSVKKDVKARTDGFIRGLGSAGEGGLIGVLSALGLHLYRNHTRRKALVERAP